MTRWITSWRFALRIARRQVWRHKARNALIVAMLALPVFGTVGVETLLGTSLHLSAAEKLTRQVGGFDAKVEAPLGSAISQAPDGSRSEMVGGGAEKGASATDVQDLLPSATLTPERLAGSAYFSGSAGYATGAYWQVDLGNPDTAGVFDLVSGRVPRTAQEIDLSPALAAGLGVGVGQPVTLARESTAGGTAAQFTVVGLVKLPNAATSPDAFALPTAPAAVGESTEGWFVSVPGGVSWDQVQAFNQLGFPVISRAVVLDPPPSSQVPFDGPGFPALVGGLPLQAVAVPAAILGIVIGIALLEVVLLAGPGFAVSARRREREYAMLGAAGADGKQLRRIVLADGMVLGAIAGVLGVGLGIGAATAVLPFIARHAGQIPGAVRVNAPHAVGVAVLAVFLGLCSALVPARSAARREVMATLGGRRTVAARRGRRVAGICWGVGLAAAGLVFEYFGRQISLAAAPVLITGGIAMIEVGAILCTPTIVAGVATLGRLLPLGPRLALRDSARHSGRTTPAVAAMFAAVAGAVAAGAWFDSSAAQQRAQYTPMLLPNQIAVQASAEDVPQIISALRPVLPDMSGSTTTESVAGYQESIDDSSQWVTSGFTPGDTPACAVSGVTTIPTAQLGMGGCGIYFTPTSYEGELIGDAQTLREVTGVEDAAADRVLAEGGIVVTTPDTVKDGRIGLIVRHQSIAPHATEATQTTAVRTLPAVYLNLQGKPDPGFIIAPAAAAELGLEAPAAVKTTLVVDLAQRATTQQVLQANETLQRLHLSGDFQQDGGVVEYRSLANLVVLAFTVLLALAAAAIATGLALADGRADQETLTAVGGSPGTRRWLAGSTALVITGLGVLIGVPIGFLIADGLVHVNGLNLVGLQGEQPMPFTIPWLNLGAMAVAVPLLTAAGAMLLSRSKTPDRRVRLD